MDNRFKYPLPSGLSLGNIPGGIDTWATDGWLLIRYSECLCRNEGGCFSICDLIGREALKTPHSHLHIFIYQLLRNSYGLQFFYDGTLHRISGDEAKDSTGSAPQRGTDGACLSYDSKA